MILDAEENLLTGTVSDEATGRLLETIPGGGYEGGDKESAVMIVSEQTGIAIAEKGDLQLVDVTQMIIGGKQGPPQVHPSRLSPQRHERVSICDIDINIRTLAGGLTPTTGHGVTALLSILI